MGSQQFLYSIEDPFTVELSHTEVTLWYWTPDDSFCRLSVNGFWYDRREGMRPFLPYAGKLLLRFERSPLEKHAGRRVLVLRVVQVLEPIKHLVENYDGYIKLPEEGELIVRRGKPVRIDVDIHWKNTPMNLMYDLAYPST